jgi:hypothetical protein
LTFDRGVNFVISALAVATCLGCGEPANKHGRIPFSGTVTLDGQPLAKGYLIFEPKAGQPTQSGGMIKDGKFDVPANAGAAPGLYSVAIFSGSDPLPNKYEPGTPEYEAAAMRAPGEQVPPKFNINTTLTEEVKAGEENVFTFEVTRK